MRKFPFIFAALMLTTLFLFAFQPPKPPQLPDPDKIKKGEEMEDKTLSPYFFVKSGDPKTDALPLLETSADVNIAGVMADVTVKQVYENSGENPLEAIYTFPASTRAAVYSMVMKIEDRTLTAKINERKKAREKYEQAKEEGKSASLLEQQRPNVFQMNVANIMPGDTIVVELKYTELLIPENGIYEFVYPTVVGPRYSEKNADSAKDRDKFVETPYQHEGEEPLYDFDLNLQLNAGVPLDYVECKTHEVNIDKTSEKEAEINLAESEKSGGNRDFVLEYRLSGGKIQTGLLTSEGERENFFLLMLQPPKRVDRQQIPNREYIFIMDVSGSMSGYPIEVSKKTIKKLLNDLRLEDKFNVMTFAGGSKVFSEKSVHAAPENIEKAVELVGRQRGGGGTRLLPAMRRSLDIPKQKGYSRTIVVVTDGYIDVEKETFDLIRNNMNEANVFTFGIGKGVNRYLIEGMARVGKGKEFVVMHPDGAEEKAEKFREYIQSPVMTDISVDFGKFDAYDTEPKKIPDVFAERPIIIFGKYKKPAGGTIKVTGTTGNEKIETEIPVNMFATKDNSNALKYLWARQKLMMLSDYNSVMQTDKMKEEITDIGLKYNLLTRYTSFVAIDTKVRNQDTTVTVKQPLPMPEGVSDNAVGGFASNLSFSSSALKAAPRMSGGPPPGNGKVMYEKMVKIEDDKKESQIKASCDEDELRKNIVYPEKAKKDGIEGKVVVRVLVDKNGKIQNKIIEHSTDRIFNEAAVEAIDKTKFEPAKLNGKPIKGWVSVPVEFKLDGISPEERKQGYMRILGEKLKMEEMESGVKYHDKLAGSGMTAKKGMRCRIEYTAYYEDGTLLTNPGGELFEYTIGLEPSVMKGIDYGVRGMKPEGKRILLIPPEMQKGSRPDIETRSGKNLIIEIYLVKIE